MQSRECEGRQKRRQDMKYISKGDGKYEVEKLKKGGRKATRKENVKKNQ